jgi:hypothetical protein
MDAVLRNFVHILRSSADAFLSESLRWGAEDVKMHERRESWLAHEGRGKTYQLRCTHFPFPPSCAEFGWNRPTRFRSSGNLSDAEMIDDPNKSKREGFR